MNSYTRYLLRRCGRRTVAVLWLTLCRVMVAAVAVVGATLALICVEGGCWWMTPVFALMGGWAVWLLLPRREEADDEI